MFSEHLLMDMGLWELTPYAWECVCFILFGLIRYLPCTIMILILIHVEKWSVDPISLFSSCIHITCCTHPINTIYILCNVGNPEPLDQCNCGSHHSYSKLYGTHNLCVSSIPGSFKMEPVNLRYSTFVLQWWFSHDRQHTMCFSISLILMLLDCLCFELVKFFSLMHAQLQYAGWKPYWSKFRQFVGVTCRMCELTLREILHQKMMDLEFRSFCNRYHFLKIHVWLQYYLLWPT